MSADWFSAVPFPTQCREHLAVGSGEGMVPGGWDVLPSEIQGAFVHICSEVLFFTLVPVFNKRNWLAGKRELNLFQKNFRGLS